MSEMQVERHEEASPQRQAQRAGARFEAMLDTMHSVYRAEHRALVYHNGIHARFIVGHGWRPQRGLTRPDYSGVVSPWGLAIHFDAKTTDDPDGWTLKTAQAHEYTDLLEMARMGALCFFLIESTALERYFALHVSGIVPMQGHLPAPSLKWSGVPRAYDQRPRFKTFGEEIEAFGRLAKGPVPVHHRMRVIGSALWFKASGGLPDYLPHVLRAWDRLPHQPWSAALQKETPP